MTPYHGGAGGQVSARGVIFPSRQYRDGGCNIRLLTDNILAAYGSVTQLFQTTK